MALVTLGNHAAVVVSLTEQDAVRRFYRDVLDCALARSANDKDDFVLGGDFYLAVVYAEEAVTLGKEDFLKATWDLFVRQGVENRGRPRRPPHTLPCCTLRQRSDLAIPSVGAH